MDFLIKGILALFWLAVIPTACGALFFKKHDTFSFAKSLLFGYLLLFSLAELLILLFMYFNRPLHELVACYGILSAAAALSGVILLRRRKISVLPDLKAVQNTSLYFWRLSYLFYSRSASLFFWHISMLMMHSTWARLQRPSKRIRSTASMPIPAFLTSDCPDGIFCRHFRSFWQS